MFRIYANFSTPFYPSPNPSPNPNTHIKSFLPSSAAKNVLTGDLAPTCRFDFDRVKTSFKVFFHTKRTKEGVYNRTGNTSWALTTMMKKSRTSSVLRQSSQRLKIGGMDNEALDALNTLYEALHHPSILDARRHHRYGLFFPVCKFRWAGHETTYTRTYDLDTSLESTHIVSCSPRCRRTGGGVACCKAFSHDPSFIVASALVSESEDVPPAGLPALELSPPSSPSSASSSSFASPSSSSPSTAPRVHGRDLLPLQPPPVTIDAPRLLNTMDFKVIRFLGEGTSGKVYYVKDRISKTRLALKVVPKEGKSAYTLGVLIQERDLSVKLSDSCWFVHLWAAWHDRANMYFAMTLYPTDLDSEMIRCGTIEHERAKFYMAEIIIALTELHSRGIIHRDVKAPNILISRSGHIVLADFGLSKDFHSIPTIAEKVFQPYWPYLRTDNPTSETKPRDAEELSFVAWDYRGSELEMAPEVHLRQPYSFGVDYWSAAVVLYWMLTGRPPFYEDEEEYEDGGDQDVKPLPFKIAEDPLYWDPADEVDEVTRDFLEKMLEKIPKKRLLILYEIPSHPYFAGVNWPLMEAQLIPPPWVPDLDIGHVYQPTSPFFTPGGPFTEEDPDPHEEFNFISELALNSVASTEEDDSDEYDSDSASDSGSDTLTDVEHISLADDNSRVLPNVSYGQESYPAEHIYHPDSYDYDDSYTLNTNSSTFHLKERWDISMINSPSLKPSGPGPKQWLRAQDLQKIKYLPAAGGEIPVIPAHNTPTPHRPERTRSQPQEHVFDLNTNTPKCTLPPSPSISTPQLVTHVVNGTGFIFKVKIWMSKIRAPRPKKGLGPGMKRLSLLG